MKLTLLHQRERTFHQRRLQVNIYMAYLGTTTVKYLC